MEESPGRWSAGLQNLGAPMRDMDSKCFEEGWSEGVRCGETLFPGGQESCLERVCSCL